MDLNDNQPGLGSNRRSSTASQDSQTAADFISDQLRLEAEAREALPHQFDTCTYTLGALNQSLFSCLTCNPPPPDGTAAGYTPAGVCYACSISCHGEHELVELFTRRAFVCDCGTTRVPSSSTCSLRINTETSTKGGVHSETPATSNKYNQNFRNRFCGCSEDYDPHSEKGTMFQCMGLTAEQDGGCGEDWWHPECIMGLSRDWYKNRRDKNEKEDTNNNDLSSGEKSTGVTAPSVLESIAEEGENVEQPAPQAEGDVEEHPTPPGFPEEDDFDHFICFKCVEQNPWIKRYANSAGFLAAVGHASAAPASTESKSSIQELSVTHADGSNTFPDTDKPSLKRKVDDSDAGQVKPDLKRTRSEETTHTAAAGGPSCKLDSLPQGSTGEISLFLKEDFRDHLCRCPKCFPLLKDHPQLLEEEMTYEPPVSDDDSADGEGTGSVGSRSLFDRGEAALSNMDRVRAIEGVMAYNKLRDNLKNFLKPFAESGQAVGAEDIKKHFEKLRGDDQAIKEAQNKSAERGS